MQTLIIKNFFKVGIFKYSEDLLFFIGSIFISRIVGPDEYGVIVIVTIFYGFFSQFTDIGLSAYIIREKESEQSMPVLQFLFIVLSGLSGLVLIILALPISVFYNPRVLLPCMVYAVILLLNSLPRASLAQLLKNHKFDFIARIGLIKTLVTIALTYGLALLNFSYWALILPHLFPPLITLWFFRKKVSIPFLIPGKEEIKRTLKLSKSLWKNLGFFTFLNFWARNTDNFLVGKLYQTHDLGVYNRAYMFSNLPIKLFTKIFSSLQLPIFQKFVNDVHYVKTEYKKVLQLITSLIAFPFAIFYLFPEAVVKILWGQKWTEVAVYLPGLSILILVYIINSTVGDMYILFKKERNMLINGIITGTATIASLAAGAFISIPVMIRIYILAGLLINSPAVCYIGFYKSFNYTVREIIGIWSVNWLTAFSLVLMDLLKLHQLKYYPIVILLMVSCLRLNKYFNSLKIEKKRSESNAC